MTKIRLSVPEEIENEKNLDYKDIIKQFINDTLYEIKTQLSTYHSTKEIESRKRLVTFFKQKVADFELLFLLDQGIKYLHMDTKIETFNKYEDIANRLAHVYENLKNTISPSWNVKDSLQNLYFDKLEIKNKPVSHTKYLERFLRLNLVKEKLDYFDSVVIDENCLILNGTYKLVLYGELTNPKFMLLDAKIYIKNFTIEKFVNFLKLQDKYLRLNELFCKFKKLRTKLDMVLEGNYRNFRVIIDGVIFEANEDLKDIFIELFTHNLTSKYTNLKFTIDDGWFTTYENGILTNIDVLENCKVINIKNEDDILQFFKIDFASACLIRFFNPKLFYKFENVLEKENNFFKVIEKVYKKSRILRNNSEIVCDNIRFKLIGLYNNILEYELFVDDVQIHILKDGSILFDKNSNKLSISDFSYYIRNTNLKFIAQFYSLIMENTSCIKDFKMTDVSLDICFDKYKLSICKDYCIIGDIKIKNVESYLNFLFNIVRYADNILNDFLEVEIQGFNFKYNIVTHKIDTNLINKEIIGYKNIRSILQNMNFFYRYGLIPDYFSENYALFYFNDQFKIKFSKILKDDPRLWFKNLQKTVNDRSVNTEIEEFIGLYKSNKRL